MNTGVYKKKNDVYFGLGLLTLSILSNKVTQNANIAIGNHQKASYACNNYQLLLI